MSSINITVLKCTTRGKHKENQTKANKPTLKSTSAVRHWHMTRTVKSKRVPTVQHSHIQQGTRSYYVCHGAWTKEWDTKNKLCIRKPCKRTSYQPEAKATENTICISLLAHKRKRYDYIWLYMKNYWFYNRALETLSWDKTHLRSQIPNFYY